MVMFFAIKTGVLQMLQCFKKSLNVYLQFLKIASDLEPEERHAEYFQILKQTALSMKNNSLFPFLNQE